MELLLIVAKLPPVLPEPDLILRKENLLEVVALPLHRVRELPLEVFLLLLAGHLGLLLLLRSGSPLLLLDGRGHCPAVLARRRLLHQPLPEQVRRTLVGLLGPRVLPGPRRRRLPLPRLLLSLPALVGLVLLELPVLLLLGDERALLEDGLLAHRDPLHEDLHPPHVDVLALGQVADLGHGVLVHRNKQVERALSDLKGGHVRQEVVSTKETEQDEVVDQSLRVDLEAGLHRGVSHVKDEVLPQHGDVHKLVGLAVDSGNFEQELPLRLLLVLLLLHLEELHLQVRSPTVLLGLHHHLPEDVKVRLVRGERQHDEVSVQPVQHVPSVRVPSVQAPLPSDEVHNLVLTLPWDVGV
mmetsp:Transcript_5204/g.15726  ORF Transcript_5204/g.15726 Transcript_5204/m.15726 type:complete len:354 (-) Transcript_5204:821-1882(-)